MNTPPREAHAGVQARVSFALPEGESGWRAGLLGLGHRQAVALITLLSIVASVLVSWLILVLRGEPDNIAMNLVPAVLVPLLVAPLVSHNAMGLLYEVDDARKRLHQAAIRDSLTNAYNRRFFMARLDDEVPRAKRTGMPLSVLMIDIDHFKFINDTHGHAAGDAVLEDIAGLLTRALRQYDLVARYGGEEFVALLPGVELSQAQAAAERVRVAIETMQVSWAPAGRPGEATVTASLGCSCLGGDGDTVAALLERADRAMYAAKRSGRNRCIALPPGSASPQEDMAASIAAVEPHPLGEGSVAGCR